MFCCHIALQVYKLSRNNLVQDISNRILRGIRMSQYYDFNVDENTYIQMKNHLSFLLETHPNNIRLEFEKILKKGLTGFDFCCNIYITASDTET